HRAAPAARDDLTHRSRPHSDSCAAQKLCGGGCPVFLEVLKEPVVDLADPADHGQMAVAVADIGLRTRDGGGQPLAVLRGNKPVLAAMPDLDGHLDVAEIKPPASQG